MVNTEEIINNLKEFYPVNNRIITHVGIGGGILTGYTQEAKEITAIDNDVKILKPLTEKIMQNKLDKKFTIIITDFRNSRVKSDLTFFEFCMHEMEHQNEVIKHAKEISDTVLIADHARNSEWAHYTCETEKIENSWSEIENFDIIKRTGFKTHQFFNSYDELYEKLLILGDESIKRIKEFKGKTNFKIKMPYELCLI